jgi:hypothetical protein
MQPVCGGLLSALPGTCVRSRTTVRVRRTDGTCTGTLSSFIELWILRTRFKEEKSLVSNHQVPLIHNACPATSPTCVSNSLSALRGVYHGVTMELLAIGQTKKVESILGADRTTLTFDRMSAMASRAPRNGSKYRFIVHQQANIGNELKTLSPRVFRR